MRKIIAIPASIVAIILFGAKAQAADVEITWQDPQSYTDVRATNESNKRFRERTFKELEAYFNKLAEALPKGDKLSLVVNNLDLAGQVWPSNFIFGNGGGGDVRLIKQVDIPRMAFSYTLSRNNGEIVKSADVNLKDMSFMNGVSTFESDKPLSYEKTMIKDWFRKEMSDVIVKND